MPPPHSPNPSPRADFPKTWWTGIEKAGALTPDGRQALASLCRAYWFPVYAFIRRRKGSSDDAYDSTQGFFACLIERNDLAKVDRARGSKFRSWLLQCVKNYLKNEHAHEHTKKRIPPELCDSLSADTVEERYQAEPSHHLTAERLYRHHFALSLLARVIDALRERYVAAEKEPLFEALKGTIAGDAAQQPYEEVAVAMRMTLGAVKKAAFDLRTRYKKLLRAEVASLIDADVDDPAVDEEVQELLAALDEGTA